MAYSAHLYPNIPQQRRGKWLVEKKQIIGQGLVWGGRMGAVGCWCLLFFSP